MTQVSFGVNSKLTVHPSDRQQIREFYCNVLGCSQTGESERIDFFQIGANFSMAVVYESSALSMTNYKKAIWLELCTSDTALLKKKILAFGIKEIEYWDKDHFYFQAPGGQVFRLATEIEN